jgi:hypothetical protein
MVMVAGRRVQVNESVVCAELDQEAVLLNVETGVYFGLDPIGTAIWKLLEAGSTEEDIIRQLTAEYEVELVQIQTDMAEFLDLLSSKGLVQVVER